VYIVTCRIAAARVGNTKASRWWWCCRCWECVESSVQWIQWSRQQTELTWQPSLHRT